MQTEEKSNNNNSIANVKSEYDRKIPIFTFDATYFCS